MLSEALLYSRRYVDARIITDDIYRSKAGGVHPACELAWFSPIILAEILTDSRSQSTNALQSRDYHSVATMRFEKTRARLNSRFSKCMSI